MEGGPIVVNQEGDEEVLNLPPGFRFHPTDEEIITHYLTQKIVNRSFTATAIGEVDLNKCEPWDLPKKAKMGEKEWFFFCQRDRKYPTGMRTNRATELGYWKATGKDKEIYRKAKSHGGQQLVGMKKTLVFYKGRAPKGEKSNWVMHEFRLDGKLSYQNFPNKTPAAAAAAKDEWVVCKVFHKNGTTVINKKNSVTDLTRMNSFVEGLLDSPSLPPLMDSPYNTNANINGTITTSIQVQVQEHGYMAPSPSINYHPSSQSTHYYNYDQVPNTMSMSYSQNANFPYQHSSSLGNYLHQQSFNFLPSNRQCKVEQYSSNLSRSQDTGLSTDLTTEISSKQQMDRSKPTYCEDAEGTSAGHLADSDSFWDFQ